MVQIIHTVLLTISLSILAITFQRYQFVVKNRKTKGVSDTGATVNLISDSEATRLRLIRHKLDKPLRINYGKSGSYTDCYFYIKGSGLLDKIIIAKDSAVTLISTRTFTDQGLSVTYTKTRAIVWDPQSKQQVISAMFSQSTNLWEFDLVKLLAHPGIIKTTRQAMAATDSISFAAFDEASINLAAGFNVASEGRENLRQHISKVFLSPPDDTLAKMIDKGWVINVPGDVTGAEIRKHPINSIATGLGHMKQVRQTHHKPRKKPDASAMIFSTDDEYYDDGDGQVRDVDSDHDDDSDDWGSTAMITTSMATSSISKMMRSTKTQPSTPTTSLSSQTANSSYMVSKTSRMPRTKKSKNVRAGKTAPAQRTHCPPHPMELI